MIGRVSHQVDDSGGQFLTDTLGVVVHGCSLGGWSSYPTIYRTGHEKIAAERYLHDVHGVDSALTMGWVGVTGSTRNLAMLLKVGLLRAALMFTSAQTISRYSTEQNSRWT